MTRERVNKMTPISHVYNDGKLSIVLVSQTGYYDEYNTWIPSSVSEETEQKTYWFRDLGITAQDLYYAQSLGTLITRKVAIKGKRRIKADGVVKINDSVFSIHRVFYSYKNNETEITLKERELERG